jgi:hypothetical protein
VQVVQSTTSTRRHIPEDGILHSHRHENLKSSFLYVHPNSRLLYGLLSGRLPRGFIIKILYEFLALHLGYTPAQRNLVDACTDPDSPLYAIFKLTSDWGHKEFCLVGYNAG